MAERLRHHQIQAMLEALGEAKVIDLDTPVRRIMEQAAPVLRQTPDVEVNLHILCCNEYGFITK